jgi:hypothetical protein
MAPQVVAHPGTRPTRRLTTVDEVRITPAGDPFYAAPHHDGQDERPHACNDGWVTLGQLVVDPETGEETEEYALYLCRRCADSR